MIWIAVPIYNTEDDAFMKVSLVNSHILCAICTP